MPDLLAVHTHYLAQYKADKKSMFSPPKRSGKEKPNLVRSPGHHSLTQVGWESDPLAAVKAWADESQLHNVDVRQVDLPAATATVKSSVSLPSKQYRKSQEQQHLLLHQRVTQHSGATY